MVVWTTAANGVLASVLAIMLVTHNCGVLLTIIIVE